MDHKTLELATDNFGDSNMLGAGGFGCVYHGKLEGNLCVAVKRLSGANLDAIKEFQTEVELLSKIQHPNIITLLGYSIHADTRLLIYELMEYGSLETQLHGPSRGSALTWHLRMKIALDAARGLEYLHEHCHPPVIHRDLKSSNILLDSNFNAKAMPQLTDRTKLPNIVDPVIRNSVDLKHLYQVAAVAVLCVQPEPSYRPLITDILHSLVPLVPVELGGTLREAKAVATTPSEI
ncbi:UNVERIFIED_CONTAM: putative receptor-like protein kinase [Sesamum radiatum]|uniref:Receptor-like protein kinase n=1 Tax=Sesamum radiatum TaxID=300843 RepID=A0AAW2NEU5_SESRA